VTRNLDAGQVFRIENYPNSAAKTMAMIITITNTHPINITFFEEKYKIHLEFGVQFKYSGIDIRTGIISK